MESKEELKKTVNRKMIGITAAIAAAVCIAVLAVIFAKGGSTEKRLAEQAEMQEAAQAVEDRESGTGQEAAQYTEDGEAETETSSPLGIGEVTAGQIITFGSCEQDGNTANGKEPIEWYVLEASGGEAVLLSVYLLDCQPYHETWEDTAWENCTLRRWLNSEFYNTAFSAEEQQVIVNANVINEDNPFWGTEGGSNTADKVWLLSLGEVEKYFHIDRNVWNEVDNETMSWEEYAVYCYGQDHRVGAKPTAYAEAEGLYVYSKEDAQADLGNTGIDTSYAVGSGWWWLRSPGSYGGNAVYVLHVGAVDSGGIYVDYDYGVRPALKVAY